MLSAWNGANRPAPSRGEGTIEGMIPRAASQPHEGLFFGFGHDEGNQHAEGNDEHGNVDHVHRHHLLLRVDPRKDMRGTPHGKLVYCGLSISYANMCLQIFEGK